MALRLTVNVRSVVPLSPSTTFGESTDSVRVSRTVTFTVSVSLSPSAVTVSVNLSVVSSSTSGAVKRGLAVVAPVSVAVGLPLVCCHE